MSAWIGPLGSLFEFKCPSAVESQSKDAHVYFEPLGGSITTTVIGDATRPRVWDVSVSTARPNDVAALQGLAEGEWGPGPFVFIPPAAETLNLLGKRDALAQGNPPVALGYVPQRPGTLVETSEGATGSAYICTREVPGLGSFGYAPVIPGRAVTVRAWVAPSATMDGSIRLRIYTAGGTLLLTTPIMATTTGGFVHSTAVPPVGAAYVELLALGSIVARPSITWTDTPRTWAPSKASQNVVVSPLSDAVRRATGTPGEETITDHRFTVTELRA